MDGNCSYNKKKAFAVHREKETGSGLEMDWKLTGSRLEVDWKWTLVDFVYDGLEKLKILTLRCQLNE